MTKVCPVTEAMIEAGVLALYEFDLETQPYAEAVRAVYTAMEAARIPDPEVPKLREENERLTKLLNTPEVDDFAKGAVLEAAHQRERWGADHDAGKTPFDWFWLVGYLAQKAAASAVTGNNEKALHHTISTAAALANWHLALSGGDTSMRPGIGPQNGGEKAGSAYDLASKLNDAALNPSPALVRHG